MKPAQFETKMKAAGQEVGKGTELLTQVALTALASSQRHTPVDTGTLRRSETFRVEQDRAYIGTAIEYAPFVHYGTKYMPARPFFEEGIAASRSDIERIAGDWGAKVLTKVGQ